MRFDLVVERLAALPAILPPPAAALIPIIVDGSGWGPSGGAPGTQPGSLPRTPPAGRAARSGRPAGVLVLLYPDPAGVARVVLTERASREGHHSGEVSFPGGAFEPDDLDITATALREAAEEIALDAVAAGLRVVGLLERFWIPVSDFEVTPVMAVAARRPSLTASPAEVARILEPPISRFLPGARIEIVERTIRDRPLRYGAYDVDGLSVWGATARVLSQLGAILAR